MNRVTACRGAMGIAIGILLATSISACAVRGPEALAGLELSIDGYLTVLYGDPLPPAGGAAHYFTLTETSGTTHDALPDTLAGMTAETLRRYDRLFVRAVGVVLGDSTPTFLISRIDSIPSDQRGAKRSEYPVRLSGSW